MGDKGTRLGDRIFTTDVVEVRDVVGAGDTFLSALVLNYLKSGDINESIRVANICATESVKHKGVVDLNKLNISI
jgi:D-beta-D-heptose 7-phosphate kinase/D-beta-D-heptose 1-phosphate adenosyltransferase